MDDKRYQYLDERINVLEQKLSAIEEWIRGFSPGGRIMIDTGESDPLYGEAETLVKQYDAASASLLQRRMAVGYARAARILDQLEKNGVIAHAEGAKPRRVLKK